MSADGSNAGLPATPEDAIDHALALARWFIAAGGGQPGRLRMAAVLAGTPLPAHLASRARPMAARVAPPLGLVAAGCLVGFEFGQLPAATLAALAALGPLRVTPWRSVLVEGARHSPHPEGAVCHADDPRLRVAACTGAPGCPQALGPTRPLARAIAPLVPPGEVWHVSGCAKGCAHLGATVTLVAQATGYGLIDHGDAATPPVLQALQPAEVIHRLQARTNAQQHAPHL